MAETNPAPAAGANTPDLAAQLATLTGAVTALAESQKTVMGAVEKLATAQQPATQPATATTSTTDKAKPLTLDDLTRVLNERETQSRQSAELASQRQRYVAEKLTDLPPFAATQLGNDPAKWPAEETAIRTQYREHLAAQGVKLPDVSGNSPAATTGTQKPGEVVDYSKLNPLQAIEKGLEQSVPARSASAGGAATTAGTTPAPAASAGTGTR